MANLKDLLKVALAAKNGETGADSHASTTKTDIQASVPGQRRTTNVASKKPTTRVSGRGR